MFSMYQTQTTMKNKTCAHKAEQHVDVKGVNSTCAGETVGTVCAASCVSHPNLSVRASHCQKQMVPSAPVEDR